MENYNESDDAVPVHCGVCFMWSGVFTSLAAGVLSDRIGRGWVLLTCFMGSALSLGVLALVEHRLLALAAAVVLGFQFGGVPVVATAWVGDQADSADRPMAHACAFAWRDVGIGIAAFLGGWFKQYGFSDGACFLFFSGLFLLTGLAVALFLRPEERGASATHE